MSLNKLYLVGNLGQDPELKVTKAGKPFCRINVATNDRGVNAAGGEYDRTTWHMVHVFGKQAEWVCRSLHKGSKVFVDARVDTLIEDINGEKKTQCFFHAYQVFGFSPSPSSLRALGVDSDEEDDGEGLGNFVVPNA